jgi:hypothetical protein
MYLFMTFCNAAKFYLAMTFLTMLYLVAQEDQNLIWLTLKGFAFIGWSFLLNWLCTNGYKALTWFVAIVPHLIFLVVTTTTM